MKTLLLLSILLLAGCSALDPRGPCRVTMTAHNSLTSATITYAGPTPFFVEPAASLTLDGDKVTAKIGSSAKEARGFWGGLAANIFSFLAGWLVAPGIMP